MRGKQHEMGGPERRDAVTDDQIPMIGREGTVEHRSIQDHRDEAYQTGWDDGYAEGFAKASAALASERETVERLRSVLNDFREYILRHDGDAILIGGAHHNLIWARVADVLVETPPTIQEGS